ncbi:Zinc finger, RING/FYVE/PHD-type [Artemisia annua]|uniref:RING-type E3 ubiquitin transferase n=1 Tax=Artemisia annua TaxID=35608 RepID=A0A2U1PED4_ARTAN|nr:Zinc finger, RING/FYVE/PHD-type [Artemisia annua]
MSMNTITQHTDSQYYFYLGDTPIRAYSCYTIHSIHQLHFDPYVTTRSLRLNCPQAYPWTWYVHRNRAVVVHKTDIENYENQHALPSTSTMTNPPLNPADRRYVILSNGSRDQGKFGKEVVVLQRVSMNQIDGILEQELHSRYSGLTHNEISKNLRFTKYRKGEEGEICVVCQTEFEKNQRLAVLKCKHYYHRNCIRRWLLHKNICPLCKSQVVSV